MRTHYNSKPTRRGAEIRKWHYDKHMHSWLEEFIANTEDEETLQAEFNRHSFELNFADFKPSYLSQIPNKSGIYFIGAKRNNLLKVYAGKANNIQVRITDYHRGFQVHCPNDRKMFFFQEWLREISSEWRLRLYTRLVEDSGHRSEIEATLINQLNPLVNARKRANQKERNLIEEAYKRYFFEFFSTRGAE